MKTLSHARGALSLDRCLVMGIVNRTPDSFSRDGRMELGSAVAHGLRLLDEGADLLDLGAVPAGPGEEISEEEETRRLLPLVAALAERTDVPISVETGRPGVVRRAVDAGAAMVNDVTALEDPELAAAAASTKAGLVLVHNGGQIRGRPRHPRYTDVVADVLETWDRLARQATAAGVAREAIVVDAALDFGKTVFHSLELVRRIPEQIAFGYPLLVSPSRKDVVGETLEAPSAERLEGTLALVALAAYLGADVVRVHDVEGCVRAVRMAEAVAGKTPPQAPLRGLWD